MGKQAAPIHIVLKPGEMLYLPSLYYHQVGQKELSEGYILAVNFWFDMQFDIRYNYFSFLDGLARATGN